MGWASHIGRANRESAPERRRSEDVVLEEWGRVGGAGTTKRRAMAKASRQDHEPDAKNDRYHG